MFVVYDGPFDGVVLPDGRVFEAGSPVEVDVDLGNVLLRQGFKSVDIEKGKGGK